MTTKEIELYQLDRWHYQYLKKLIEILKPFEKEIVRDYEIGRNLINFIIKF